MTGHEDADALHHVLTSLADRLDTQLEGLLRDETFREGREALARLREGAARDALADELDPREAGWAAQELLRRWARIAPAVLSPRARVVATADGEDVLLALEVDGVEPGWTAVWSGATPVPAGAVWQPGGAAHVTARVMGRGPDGRTILTATWSPPGNTQPSRGTQPGEGA